MKMKKSINSRRGGGGNPDASSLAWWKVLFLVSLILLVSFLAHLNYQLVKELGKPSNGDLPEEGGRSSSRKDERRLKSLRQQVSTMKEKVGDMKGKLEMVKKGSGQSSGGSGEFERITCTPAVASRQAARMNKRFVEWWSHSACPDQVWFQDIGYIFEVASHEEKNGQAPNNNPYLVLDIGCNKGYTSADFLDALSPGTNINPHSLVGAIRAVAKDMSTKFDRDGGVCNDSNKPLNMDRDTKRQVEVHCFEPSPATYNMLTLARKKLMPQGVNEEKAIWHMHNVGLHEVDGEMSWHKACATAVGDELCTIVPDGTEGAIRVPVVTVDKFLKDEYPIANSGGGGASLPLVHMLKIDAEGLDPAVLNGATSLLTQNRAIMVMFEFNPGLSEGKGDPHGMWGRRGNPHKDLLEVTTWLDELGYDCYLDTRPVDQRERDKGVPDAPALYRITGGCLTEEPRVRGWANVVCASRKFPNAASMLSNFATMAK